MPTVHGEEIPDGDLWLGFDLSTQSCKAVVIDKEFKIQYSAAVRFDDDLPSYKTKDGVHRGEGGKVTSPTLMWVEALELVLDRLKEQGCPFARIVSLSGSGQQHGTVYWSKRAGETLFDMKVEKGRLVEQLKGAFVVPDSPIWMDSSTSESCRAMEAHVGGAAELARRTGSKAYERFSAHHIRAFHKDFPEQSKDCSTISLVSSFGASMLIGGFAMIDASDGAGMNLMDISTRAWDRDLLSNFLADKDQATASALDRQLGLRTVEPWTFVGNVHLYFHQKYGFQRNAKVVAWSGDNPCSVVGLGLRGTDIAVSLGTSDTCFACLPAAPEKPLPFGHLFPHPMPPLGSLFAMLCYANGDVARRQVRDEFAAGDWSAFSEEILKEAPGNDGNFAFFLQTTEITPPLPAGKPMRAKCSDKDGSFKVEPLETFQRQASMSCRAVVEQRALSMRSHLATLYPSLFEPSRKRSRSAEEEQEANAPRLYLTGGGSANAAVRQIFSDVFGRPVVVFDVPDSAALGAARRAWHACETVDYPWKFPNTEEVIAATPKLEAVQAYQRLLPAYCCFEEATLSERG